MDAPSRRHRYVRRGAVICGRIWTPPDCNGLVGSGSLIKIADVYPASQSGPIHRRREPRWVSARFTERTAKLKTLAAQSEKARRLQTMPGVGPLTAVAVEAFGPDMAQFRTGRDFAAWLGLVPKQHSSGGKERLGRMTKAGQADIRRLLIIGAMSRLTWIGRRAIPEGSWLSRMLARKPKMLVAIALANKMARQIWAMLTKNENYRDPALAVVA